MTSFDIFDTLITRTVYEPFGIFLLIQKKLTEKGFEYPVSDYVKENYALLRHNAEKHARRTNEYDGKEEIKLDEIYLAMAQMACLSDEALTGLKKLEIQTELENSVPIPENLRLLKDCLNRKEKVILISDMYMPREVIAELLVQADPILKELPLYISSEYGKTKRSGALYLQVKADHFLSYAEWTHYGDNYFSDVKVPNMLGINAVWIRGELPAVCSDIQRDKGVNGDITVQIFWGVSQNVIEKYSLKGREIIGASVGAFLLYPYVYWVIHTSLELGYNRLFFVARDGFVLKKIADEIILANQYKLRTKYLYGSRKAWRVDTEEEKKLLYEYLIQEIGVLDNKFAFVDLQGTGLSMEYLFRILKSSMDSNLNVFYYQLYSGKHKRCYNFMPFTILEDAAFIEIFARAPHGATIGYKEKDRKIFPVLAETGEDIWEKYGLPDYIKGAEAFAKEITQVLKNLRIRGDSLKVVSWALQNAQDNPDENLLKFIGDMPHNNTINDLQSTFAPRLSRKEIYKLYMWRTTEPIQKVYQGNNLSFSEKRMNAQDKRRKSFYEKNYYSWLGNTVHQLKYITNKKKKLQGYKKVLIYAAGEKGRWLYNFITFETKSKVVGWADMNYQKLREKGMPVISLREALKTQYDVLVIAINNVNVCKKLEEQFISVGIDKSKIMCINEFCDMVEK